MTDWLFWVFTFVVIVLAILADMAPPPPPRRYPRKEDHPDFIPMTPWEEARLRWHPKDRR